jgi:hypothetical protein
VRKPQVSAGKVRKPQVSALININMC